jgi:hypothetical protein
MTTNQKIALGCGGAGCLGLIILALVGAVVWMTYHRRPAAYRANRNYNFNLNANRSSNSNSNSSTDNSNSSLVSSSSMSEDDKHKLFQAAATSGDQELMSRAMDKIGLSQSKPEENQQFMKDHLVWIFKNTSFIKEINTPEKARAYVGEHIND